MKLLKILFLLSLFCQKLSAQLIVDAGINQSICKGSSVVIGGNPSATGDAPFRYHWLPSTNLSSDTVANPEANPTITTIYYLSVTDSNSHTSIDSVIITVFNKYSPLIFASGTNICLGQSVNLNAVLLSGVSCLTGTSGNHGMLSSPIGTGNVIQPGTALQSPSLFGNYLKSNRNQMLYKAAELQAALGGPQLITSIFFNLAIFNSTSQLQNFSIKMGCTNIDSLTDWNNNLTEVYSANGFHPSRAPWYNAFNLSTPFYWDGTSDLIVDICNYNPQTFGNQNNKAQCTNTPFKSYLYSSGNANQCTSYFLPTQSFTRPNIKFGYDSSVSNLTPIISGATFNWSSYSGTQTFAIQNPHASLITPTISDTYIVEVTDTLGCKEEDSIYINVNIPSTTSLITTDTVCYGALNGTITVKLNSTQERIDYSLTNSNQSYIFYSGSITGNLDTTFSGLAPGFYHLLFSDSVCSSIDEKITVASFTAISTGQPTYNNISCFGGTTSACTTPTGGTPPYQYFWDTVLYNSCYPNLTAGTHSLLITDAHNCEKATTFTILQPDTLQIIISINSNLVSVYSTGGMPEYTIQWGDNTANSTPDSVSHVYQSEGLFYITISDLLGCTQTDSVLIVANPTTNISGNKIFLLFPNPATNQLHIYTNSISIETLRIYNSTDQLILQAKQPINNTIDISSLSSGVYIAEIKTKTGSVIKRWVKM
jgi:hypothetical protein